MTENGRIEKETMVRFERRLPGPIDGVWAFITESEHLARWLGPGTIEPRGGGAVNIGDGHIRGVVTQWDPPHLLAYTWNVFSPGESRSAYPESYVSIRLEPEGDQVRLTLTHRPILAGFEGLTMMGWHTFLELLEALLRGEALEPREIVMERNRVRYGVEKLPK